MANHRKKTKGLGTDDVQGLNHAWHHAATIGRPLNVLISMRPLNIDDITPAERCLLFTALRNKLSVYARRARFEPTSIWTREASPDGSGEHMHVLMHVPKRHRAHFEDTVLRWLPGPAEIDVTTADQRTRLTHDGKRQSAVSYISKQMTPQAWYKRGLIRKPGGPILGKRAGVTRNLDRRTRDTHRKIWGRKEAPDMNAAPRELLRQTRQALAAMPSPPAAVGVYLAGCTVQGGSDGAAGKTRTKRSPGCGK